MTSARMPSYAKYVAIFRDKFDLDYAALEDAYLNFSDAVGVYPDVSLLLHSLAEQEGLSTIVEFGSGMSTCVLAGASALFGKSFTSVESSSLWSSRVRQALTAIGQDAGCLINTEDTGEFPELPEEIDFLWVDGHILNVPDKIVGRVDACRYYQGRLADTLLAFDDAQWFEPQIQMWLAESGLAPGREFMWFNPTGRSDRHVLLSVPQSKNYIVDVVRGCE